MSDNLKPKTPPRALFDSQFPKEESHVRARRSGAEMTPRAIGGRAVGPAADGETVAERTTRIERKISVATLVLQRISPTDARARLLASAVLRRDEVLLDAVLVEMTDEVIGITSSRRGPASGW